MISSKTILGTLAALGLVGSLGGCRGENAPEDKVRFLSDRDGDGMFSTAECDDPSAPEGACVIIPGPVDCDYIIFTSTWTVITDASGNVVSEGWQDCIQCADASFTPVGVAECSGGTVDPIVCEALDDVLPSAGGGGTMSGGGAPGAETDPARVDYYGGGGTFPTSTCWWCHTTDGSTSYVECVEPPPPPCTSDDECGPGYRCDYWGAPPAPCDSPDGYCPAFLVAAGTCVPDYATYCASDYECGPGYYCEYGYGGGGDCYPTPDGGYVCSGGGYGGVPASDPAAPIAPPGGTCQPLPVTDFCYSDDDCRGFGEGWICQFDTWTCPEGYACPAAGGEGDSPAGVPAVMSGTCQPPVEPWPVDPCADLKDSGSCLATPGCNWAEYDIACGTDELCPGFCYGAYVVDGGGAGGSGGSP